MSFIWFILNKIRGFGGSPKTTTFFQTLKGHNLDCVCPFEMKFHVEYYFDELYPSHPSKSLKTQKHVTKKYPIQFNYV